MPKLMRVLRFLCAIFLIIFISGCLDSSQAIDTPTPEFYINDHADALLQSTKWYIYVNGESYYEDTQESSIDSQIQGTQIVVFTYIGDNSTIDTTAIFNSYGVGKNDLGIMIFLFFEQTEDDLVYQSIIVEIGTRMSTYLSAFEANQIVDEYFYDDTLFLVDDQIMQLYLKLMYVTAFKIYGWDENLMYETYLNIDDYALEQFEVTNLLPSESNQFNLQIEPYMVILIIIGLLVVFGGGGRYLIYPLLSMIGVKSNKGGGGKSGGYWFKK